MFETRLTYQKGNLIGIVCFSEQIHISFLKISTMMCVFLESVLLEWKQMWMHIDVFVNCAWWNVNFFRVLTWTKMFNFKKMKFYIFYMSLKCHKINLIEVILFSEQICILFFKIFTMMCFIPYSLFLEWKNVATYWPFRLYLKIDFSSYAFTTTENFIGISICISLYSTYFMLCFLFLINISVQHYINKTH